MGWNSWDAYGFTIDEADFKANATVLAGIERYGWQYAVIDEGWYMANPNGHNARRQKIPLGSRTACSFPIQSAFLRRQTAQGFKPLADWVHAQGLKFGIHIVRGIPRQVVKENLPIAGSNFHAEDAADLTSPCPWDEGNWGVKDNAAGQAYYDSMLKLYARWGLDFIKVDCISDHPYRPTEIRQIADRHQENRPPHRPQPLARPHLARRTPSRSANTRRCGASPTTIGTFGPSHHKLGKGEFPFGIREAFDRLAEWVPYVNPGNWPDMDMLPWGWLGPHPGWGEPGSPAKPTTSSEPNSRSGPLPAPR